MFSILNKKNGELALVVTGSFILGKAILFGLDKGAAAFTTWYNTPKTETKPVVVKSVS